MTDENVPVHPGGNSAAMLQSYANRMKNLLDEQDVLKDDLKELKSEAKGMGFDTKALSEVVKRMREDDEKKKKREELEAVMETYLISLGLM